MPPRAAYRAAGPTGGRQAVPAAGACCRGTIGLVVIFRDARREDVPAIVALLADDVLGAEREAAADEAYQAAFEQVQADPRSRLIVAEADGQVAGTLQLSLLPGLSRHGMLRAQIEGGPGRGLRTAARGSAGR